MVYVGKNVKDHPVMGHFPLDQLTKAPSDLALNNSRDRISNYYNFVKINGQVEEREAGYAPGQGRRADENASRRLSPSNQDTKQKDVVNLCSDAEGSLFRRKSLKLIFLLK